ncbi:MAG: hypothetical protein DLM72_06080 [Candidatus Nitrosopolaris wilkensis]|nr:MAG: hypothetical protein DLM72_06080 [Candidatus Nitrosopolaris wilkensis]
MSNATIGMVVGMFAALLSVSTYIAYGQNASNFSGLTIDQLRFGLHTFQQLDKDSYAGNLTARDINNAHIACTHLKQSRAPMFMFHLCSLMPR